MGMYRTVIPITGDGTVTMDSRETGFVAAVEWVVGTLGGTVDAVFSVVNAPSGVNRTLLTLTNASANAVYPVRRLESDNGGTTLATYTYDILDGSLRVVTTQTAGAATAGTAVVYWFD